jgi:hypothetical protein
MMAVMLSTGPTMWPLLLLRQLSLELNTLSAFVYLLQGKLS